MASKTFSYAGRGRSARSRRKLEVSRTVKRADRSAGAAGQSCLEVFPERDSFASAVFFGRDLEAFLELRIELLENVIEVFGTNEGRRRFTGLRDDEASFPLAHLLEERATLRTRDIGGDGDVQTLHGQ